MDIQAIQAIASLGASITTSGFLLLAWMLERRRADRLESIVTTDWLRTRTIDMTKKTEE